MNRELLECLSRAEEVEDFRELCRLYRLDFQEAYATVESYMQEPVNSYASRDIERCLTRMYRAKEIPIAPKSEERLYSNVTKQGLRDLFAIRNELVTGPYKQLWRWCAYPGALLVYSRVLWRACFSLEDLYKAFHIEPSMTVRDVFTTVFPEY